MLSKNADNDIRKTLTYLILQEKLPEELSYYILTFITPSYGILNPFELGKYGFFELCCKSNSSSAILIEAAREGYIEIVRIKVTKVEKWILNRGLGIACFKNDVKMIDLLVKNGADDWNTGLMESCRGGYEEVALYMIDRGATNYDESFFYGCIFGHINICKLLICIVKDPSRCLEAAMKSGNEEITRMIVRTMI